MLFCESDVTKQLDGNGFQRNGVIHRLISYNADQSILPERTALKLPLTPMGIAAFDDEMAGEVSTDFLLFGRLLPPRLIRTREMFITMLVVIPTDFRSCGRWPDYDVFEYSCG